MFRKVLFVFTLFFTYSFAETIVIDNPVIMDNKTLEKIYKEYIDKTYPKKAKAWNEHASKLKKEKEKKAWDNIKYSTNHQDFLNYIKKYPTSKYINDARNNAKKHKGISHFGYSYNTVKSPYTGKIWLDRNLGAKRICQRYNDSQCYGHYVQWGRYSDGHEKQNSLTTTALSYTTNPSHSKFIKSDSKTSYRWTNSKDNKTWQGLYALNNPCPKGFRVPTIDELTNETSKQGLKNNKKLFNSFLKLPSAGYRDSRGSAKLTRQGNYGYIWSSTPSGNDARSLSFSSSDVVPYNYGRANGFSVRCIKN